MAADKGEEPGVRLSIDDRRLARRVWIAVAIVTVVAVTLFVAWNASNIILVIFAGGLLAVFLHSISQWIHRRTSLSRRAALFVTLGITVAIVALTAWFTAPSIADQARRLRPTLTDALRTLQAQFSEFPTDTESNGPAGFIE